MYMRLAFAVAAHLDSEVLVVDEVLAVGDAEFQRKCLAKMDELSGRGRTVLFVSHNMPAVERLCTRAILLERARIVMDGTAHDVVDAYAEAAAAATNLDLARRTDRQGSGRLRFSHLGYRLKTGSDSEIQLTYVSTSELRNVDFAISLYTSDGAGAGHFWTTSAGRQFDRLAASGQVTCRIPRTGLYPGTYSVNLFATVGGEVADYVLDAARVEVMEGDFFGTGRLPPPGHGPVLIDHSWSVP
jgi:lipopolysaccharide transport system ATP-binding protein